MNKQQIVHQIVSGQAFLGIELGSTRIKAVLIGNDHAPIASGSFAWENQLKNGIWTYSLEGVWQGVQDSYKKLVMDVRQTYGVQLRSLSAIGVSAMMHGYLVFDKHDELLVPFRTWRNTMTETAAAELTSLFDFNVPQRWGIAHLYQAILNKEPHVPDIAFMTTLSGYIHWKLTGEKVLGVGDASGIFPIDSEKNNYNDRMLRLFNEKTASKKYGWTLEDILPRVLQAGTAAGALTQEGARLLDPYGQLEAGIPLCPPEGDAGTGMVATNSVAMRTGNISAGTSVFAMIVLEKPLSHVYPEIDMVTTPVGRPVAMVHCNNCTSDLDAWIGLFKEWNKLAGINMETSELYDILYAKALEGEADCGGILSYNYVSGEPLTGLTEGRPLLFRLPDSRLSLANFMRAQLFAAMATLKLGMDILVEKENVKVECFMGHGGLFKTKTVGQQLMAAAMNGSVAVMDTAGEGGAWGIALLAAYMRNRNSTETLEEYLDEKVFAGNAGSRIEPNAQDREGFCAFMERYVAGLAIEKAAAENIF